MLKPMMAQMGGQSKQAMAGLDLYVTLFKAAEKEVASFGLGLDRDEQGAVRLSKRARLVPDGDWAHFAAEVKPSKHNFLTGLPAGPFIVAGGGPFSEEATNKMMEFSFGMLKQMRSCTG